MSTYHSNGKASSRGLKIALFVTITLLVAVSLVLGLCLNKKTEVSVLPEDNVKTVKLDSSALLGENGWNTSIAMSLYNSLCGTGDNVALGNAGGVISSREISLGGYSWSVVYKQNGIVTLYANEPVAYLNFDKSSKSYINSAVREYLNGEFYETLVKNVGFAGFENMIVPFGARELYYQINGVQAIPLQTVLGEEIANCDGVANDKIWLPSAYEVGGFAVTETSPKARVNSFRTITSNGVSVNSGLWNLSNDSRLKVNSAVLRSSAGDGVSVVKNGVITSGETMETYAVRPCLNLIMPNVVSGVLMNAGDASYKNGSLLAGVEVDYLDELSLYADVDDAGKVFTVKTGTVIVDGVKYTYSQKFLEALSDGVNLGADMSGLTFNLVEDVDMSVFTVWDPIGKSNGFAFAGVFNGNGYKISGLSGANSGCVGLFGYVAGTGAKVQNVAVVDSTWYTTNEVVGGLVDVLGANATLENCYTESGISGKNYVGGLVGKSSATSVIKNCYNKSGVSGLSYVGGIVGSNSGAISYCYNVGAVGSGTNIGGIVGENGSSGSISNCVYSKANVSGSVTVSGVTGVDYSEMQGAKTSSGITNPKSMTAWTFDGNPWTISAVENERLPLLKTFIKKVTINVRSGDSLNKVAINDGDFGSSATLSDLDASSTTKVTIRAQSSFSGTDHYRLKSWNLYQESVGDTILSTDIEYASGGTATASGNYKTFSFELTADDSYNLEAVFEKLYSFTVSAVFNGFKSDTYADTEFKYAMSEKALDEVWYPAGTTATITIGSSSTRNWKFVGFTGSSDASSWSSLAIGETDSSAFITKTSTDKVYGATVGLSTIYVANDAYLVRANFNRYYNITLENSVPSASGTTTPVTKMVISSPSAEVQSSDATKTKEMIYSGNISASIVTTESEYTKYFTFTNWQLLNGDSAIATSTNTQSTISIGSNPIPVEDSVSALTLKATFALQVFSIGITEKVDSTADSSAGYVFLSEDGNLTSITKDSYPLSIAYGKTVYIYILPMFNTGYEFYSFNGSTTALTSVGSAGLLRTSVVATENKTYEVVFKLAEKFNVTLNATLDGKSSSGVFTFAPASYTNQIISADLSDAKVTNEAGKYFLASVTATYNGTSKTIKENRQSASGYVAQESNAVFDGLTTKTIAGLLSGIGATATYNQYNITVTANFISIVRTISVTEIWKGKTATGSDTTIGHASAYKIYDNTAKKDVPGQGTLNNEHILTATPGNGYKVKSIETTTSGITLTTILNNSDWTGQPSTATFTLSDNIAITITYEVRVYEISAVDKVGNVSGDVNTYQFKIGSDPAVTESKVYVNYGNTVTLSGYATVKDIASSNDTQKYQLRSIVVTNGSGTAIDTLTSFGSEWTRTCTDDNDNLTVTFNYVILQKVTITLTDADTTTGTNANSVLVVLKSTSKDNPNIVILATKGQADMYVNCVLGEEYTVSTIVPVYVSDTITGIDANSKITVASGSEIDVKLAQDLQKGVIFSAVIFG